MSDTKITDDGWTRDFWFRGRDEKDVEAEVSAYEDGILDAAPSEYEVEMEYHDDRICVIVRSKVSE